MKFLIIGGNLIKKLTNPYENFNRLDDYQKPVQKLKNGDFFSKLKNKGLSDDEKKTNKGKY